MPQDLTILRRADAPQAHIPPPARRWRTRVLLPAALLLTLLALLLYASRHALMPATPVRVVAAVMRPISGAAAAESVTVQAPGWIEPDPFAIGIPALAEGIVREVLVRDGQQVKTGQAVARLVDEDAKLALAKAEAQVRSLGAELAAAQAALAAAKADWENPVDRARAVAAGEAALAGAQAELDRLPSQVAVEEARLTELADRLKRIELTAGSGASTESELAETRARRQSQQAVVDATRQQKPVLEAKVRQAEADLKAAREHARLRITERKALDEAAAAVAQAEATLQHAQAARDEATLRLDRMEVRSGVDGIVMVVKTAPGRKISLSSDDPHSAEIARVYDPKFLQVRVDVPLADAAKVSVGQKAKVVVGVLPDKVMDGVVTRVVHEADIQRNTVQFKVSIAEPSPQLKPEMLARVRFVGAATATTPAASQLVFAPEQLLVRGNDGQATAWIVDRATNTAARRTLTMTDMKLDGWVAVREGLQPGDLLIASDTSSLREGTRIRILSEESSKEGL